MIQSINRILLTTTIVAGLLVGMTNQGPGAALGLALACAGGLMLTRKGPA